MIRTKQVYGGVVGFVLAPAIIALEGFAHCADVVHDIMADAVTQKFLAAPLTPDQLKELIQVQK